MSSSSTDPALAESRQRPVLVVDDDRLVLMTLTHTLRRAGVPVIEADNGDEAILLARQHQPALALLDIRMQGLSGFDVAQHLKDYTRVPFAFVSAFADEATRQQARELGALACLTKPVPALELLALVRRTMDSAAASAPPPLADGEHQPRAALPRDASVSHPVPMPALDPVALAVGAWMHSRRCSAEQAWAGLCRQAAAWSQTPEQAAVQWLTLNHGVGDAVDAVP